MKNRLRIPPRALPVLLALVISTFAYNLSAQQSAFTFSYPGPSMIGVGPNCSVTLAGSVGTPIVNSTVGATITQSEFDPDMSGFQFTDEWTPGVTLIVWWKVGDNQGNMANFSFTVTIKDLTPPEFDLTGMSNPFVVNSITQVPPAPDLPVSDNCTFSQNLIKTFTQTTPPAICQGGSFTRTWTATDEVGNQAVFTQNIIVYKDTLPPQVLVVPQNGSAPCSQLPGAYNTWLNAQMSAFFATDATGPVVYSNTAPNPYPAGCIQPLTITFRATDQCNLHTTQTVVFNSADNQAPVIVQDAQDRVVACSPPDNNHLDQLADWIHDKAGIIAVDSCPGPLTYTMQVNGQARDSAGVVNDFLASFANGCGFQFLGSQTYAQVRGYVRVDWFVADACGPPTFAGQGVFGAIDTVPPQIIGPAVTDEQCGNSNVLALQSWVENYGNATLDDDCSTPSWEADFTWITDNGQTGAGTIGVGPYPQPPAHDCNWWVDVTFKASDDCGNDTTRVLRFRIIDNLPPLISGVPPTDTVYCPAALPALFPGTAIDNCDLNPTVVRTVAYQDTVCAGNYTALVTWTATDDCGNSAAFTQQIFVQDTVRPVFTLVPPADTFPCYNPALPPLPQIGVDLIATDPCGQIDTLFITETSTQNPDPGVCAHFTYTVTRTFTAYDQCGNSATASQSFLIIDNQPPGFTGFTDTVLVCEIQPLTPPPAASDLCSGVLGSPELFDQIFTGGSCADSYTLTYIWRVSDVCGNTVFFEQNLNIQDTVKPTLNGVPAPVFVECDAIPAPPDNLVASDNCDEAPEITFLETELRDPNPANCAHWTNYMIRREWTVTDNCGNSRVYTQNISVQDNTGPVIVPQDSVARPNEPGLCGATVSVPTPLALYDRCTSIDSTILLQSTVTLKNTSGLPLNSSPVDTVVFSWPSPNLPPNMPVVGSATLTIQLESVDAESAGEFFTILGEDNYPLGTTMPTDAQCGNGTTTITISEDLLNNWLTDGTLTLKLAPFGTGATAINLVCGGGKAKAQLGYVMAVQQIPPVVSFSVNGGPQQPYPPATGFFLPVGLHTITYYAQDCAGNQSSASTTLEVEDLDPPAIVAPAAQTAYVSSGNCSANVTLPFPGLSDNCGFSGDIERVSDQVLVQFEQDPNAGWIPQTTTLTINSLIPNAVTGGVLKIRHRGDNSQSGEFFEIFDENNVSLIPATNYGTPAGECSAFNETTLNVSAAQINSWAANQSASFILVPNNDAGSYTDFINNCAPLNASNFDGISALEASLSYNFAVVNYEILNSGNLQVAAGQLTGANTQVSLQPGVYTVIYSVVDAGGTPNSAQFTLTVRDTIDPVAACTPTTIFTNPSGAVNYTLQPSEINNGSTDNCPGNLSYSVAPSSFNCNQVGTPVFVTLTVTDASMNVSTCTTQVNVQTMSFQPTTSGNVCEGGMVSLFANPPGPPNIVYTYLWKKPNGSNWTTMANPTITNATLADEGVYTVIITGPTLCTAVGYVNVDLINLPGTPTVTTPLQSVCEGQNVTLSTSVYPGSNVTYQWYEVTPNGNVLLSTTTLASYTVVQPSVGNHQYVMQVFANNCSSNFSTPLAVTVNARPVASVSQAAISICQGQPLSLGTPVQGVTYAWTGPANFTSNQQFPLVTSSADMIHEGTYSLVVTQFGCSSLPATVSVDIREKPATPQLSGASAICTGGTVTLTAIPTMGQFQWIAPDGDTVFTGINQLILSNVMPADSGAWRVRIVQNGCVSDASAPILVQVQNYPQVTASQAAPLCQGQPLPLQATSDNLNVTYSWVGPDGFTAGNIPNPVDPTPASGTYTVTATTSFGCSASSSVAVTVVTPPTVVVTNTAPLCADGTMNAQLQSIVFSPNTPLFYSWTGGPGGTFSSSDPNPVIPAVSEANNGSYMLVVTDNFGCKSVPATTVIDVENAPMVPILAPVGAVCEGGTIILTITNPSSLPGISYIWQTPNGTSTVTSQPSLVFQNATMQNNGTYSVYATTSTCASAPSASVNVIVNELPDAPLITTLNATPCEGDSLWLIGPAGFDGYQWTGPNGLTATIPSPVFPGVDSMMHTGLYRLRVMDNNCFSPYSEPLEIVVRKRPKQPVALAAEAVCLDQPDVLQLQITVASAEPGAQFTWYDAGSQQALAPPTFSHSVQITDLSGFSAGTHTIYVVATENGCSSTSTPITVNFDEAPGNTAFAGDSIAACNNQPIFLNATPPFPGIGQWSQIAGLPVTIANPAANNSQIIGGVAGVHYQFVWTLSAGACKNYSSDTVSLTITQPEQAQVLAAFIDTCFSTCAELHAVQGQNVSGYWWQEPNQADLGSVILDPTNPHTTVCGLQAGATWIFFWTLDNGACGLSQAKVEVRTIGSEAYAGLDRSFCSNDSCFVLQAADIGEFETGAWTSPNNPGITFSSPNLETTVACGLQVGDNLFVWTTNGGFCGDRSTDSVIVHYEMTPTTLPDTITVPFGTTLPLNILDNDNLPDQYRLEVVIWPQQGSFDQNTLFYQPDLDFAGADKLHYRICNLSCVGEGACSGETVVILNIEEAKGCGIPTLITPNGDDYNDEFFIPCLKDFPDHEVTIFNVWGDEVFHAQPYDNQWQGTYNGEPLPAGTYYFVVRFNNEPDGIKTGFLIIQR